MATTNSAHELNGLGITLAQQGRLGEAIVSFRRALQLKPDLAQAHHNLGIALQEQGQLDEAVVSYQRALELKPDYVSAHNYLGTAFKEQNKLNEAIACYRRALELKPDFVEACNNLGNAFKDLGRVPEAIGWYRKALELKSDFAEAHNNLGNALQGQGQLAEAIACYQRALHHNPGDPIAHNNLGAAFQEQGQPAEAEACCRRALELKPDFAEAHYNLGAVFRDQGKPDEAAACYRCALELKPGYAEAHNSLGKTFKDQGKLDEAVGCYRRALELKPDYAGAHNSLGNAFKDQGKLDEAVACYRRALELKPDSAQAHSNLVYTLIFCPGYDARTLFEEHRRWDQQHAAALGNFIPPHHNARSPGRRLRIGYISPDFRNHCQAHFTVPLFSCHDHLDFEIFCYADVARPDNVTERLRSHADMWRSISGLEDERVAQWIRQDEIDILVDLTMHMGCNRLLVLARKPAPVQVCWLAYPGTTGLSTIDYRLTDPYLDPPGGNDQNYAEESVRLPDTFWCYDPLTNEPASNALPAGEKDYITFGCLNNFCKVNPAVLKLWARVLKAVERSRLLVLAPESRHCQHTLDLLEQEGITPDRVTLVAPRPRPHYLELYHRIDLGLDTFPYNGHTTSLDSFWMGVPVVTLVGPTVVGRAGLCQLMNLRLPELIAFSPEQYVTVATELAQDRGRLSGLRATLRERMRASPLMDAPRFARNIEAAYRAMWRRWCVK